MSRGDHGSSLGGGGVGDQLRIHVLRGRRGRARARRLVHDSKTRQCLYQLAAHHLGAAPARCAGHDATDLPHPRAAQIGAHAAVDRCSQPFGGWGGINHNNRGASGAAPGFAQARVHPIIRSDPHHHHVRRTRNHRAPQELGQLCVTHHHDRGLALALAQGCRQGAGQRRLVRLQFNEMAGDGVAQQQFTRTRPPARGQPAQMGAEKRIAFRQGPREQGGHLARVEVGAALGIAPQQ